MRSIKRSAYSFAGLGKNGAPKHVEKVDSISDPDPISVEPTLAVYPLKKWYAAASLDNNETGAVSYTHLRAHET